MTPTLDSLARQLAAHPRWRWLPGMAAIESAAPGMALTDGRPVRVDTTWASVGLWIPDLSDPVTAAALVVVAREVSGDPHLRVWARRIGEDVWCVAAGVDGPRGMLYTHRSEVEALASVILRGGE